MSAATSVRDRVQQFVTENLVSVISKSYCPYCSKAKATLGNYKLKGYKVWEIENESDMDAIQDALKDMTGARSVPRVFIGGKFLGGGDDTAAAHTSGKLKELLEKAGALEN